MTGEDRPAYVTAFNQGAAIHASPRVPNPVARREGRYSAVCGMHVANVTREEFTRLTADACPACVGLLANQGAI